MMALCSAESWSTVGMSPYRRPAGMPDPPISMRPPEKTMDGVLGIEILDADPEIAHAQMKVTDAILQPYGIVHGGAYAAMAETLASATTVMAVWNGGMI